MERREGALQILTASFAADKPRRLSSGSARRAGLPQGALRDPAERPREGPSSCLRCTTRDDEWRHHLWRVSGRAHVRCTHQPAECGSLVGRRERRISQGQSLSNLHRPNHADSCNRRTRFVLLRCRLHRSKGRPRARPYQRPRGLRTKSSPTSSSLSSPNDPQRAAHLLQECRVSHLRSRRDRRESRLRHDLRILISLHRSLSFYAT